jgi:magnesium-transporting ATPase (P-type)
LSLQPSAEGSVIKLVRSNEPEAVILAIGDGGNDVSIIQAAHIGVGLYGKEGRQAADASDFAVSEFQHLRSLLFVHGRWNSGRVAFYIQFFFFKNLLFTLPQFYFAFFSGFSAQTVWDDWYLLLFNSAFTAAGIFHHAILDKDLNPKTNPALKAALPYMYRESRTSNLLSLRSFAWWFLGAIAGSLLVFSIPAYTYWAKIVNAD